IRVNPWLVVFSRLRLSHAPVVNSPPTVKPEIFCALAAVGKSFRCPGGSGMGLALLAVIWLITLVSTYFFVAKTWCLPVVAAEAAGFIDHQFALTYVLMGIVFLDRKSTRLNSSHQIISYAVFCLKKKKIKIYTHTIETSSSC